MSELCIIKTGKGVTKKDAQPNGIYPIISGGKSPMEFIDIYNRDENTVTISRVGAYAGFVDYQTQKFYLNDKCFSAIPKVDFVIPKFLYYTLKNREQKIMELQSEGGVPTINTEKIGNIKIQIPSLDVQQHIVEILDRFETLTNDLTSGLPAEIAARQQQYEYYRNKLLSFERIA